MGGWHDYEDSSEARLIGGPVQDKKEEAVQANPITYVTPETPPFLIIHGDKDEIVPYRQAEILFEALPSATLIRVKNGDHDYNDGNIYWGEIYQINLTFFNKHLKAPKETKDDINNRKEHMRQQVKYYSRDKT